MSAQQDRLYPGRAPVLTPEGVLGALAKRRSDWPQRVRVALDAKRVLRELVKTAVVLALTTKTAPRTADDVAIIAAQVTKDVGL